MIEPQIHTYHTKFCSIIIIAFDGFEQLLNCLPISVQDRGGGVGVEGMGRKERGSRDE